MDSVLNDTPAELTIEQKRAHFWEKQEGLDYWSVPMGMDKLAMPWQAEGETGMRETIVRARSQGKTPLLIDPWKMTDKYFEELDASVVDLMELVWHRKLAPADAAEKARAPWNAAMRGPRVPARARRGGAGERGEGSSARGRAGAAARSARHGSAAL